MKSLLTAAVILTAVSLVQAQPEQPLPQLSTEGRFLYANDDDWDWASPLGANKLSGLSTYGKMPWSALDWIEEGLDEVRGVLLGTPPLLGNYLTMGDLNQLRGAGPKCSYENIYHKPGALAAQITGKKPPNVIILMQDIGSNGKPVITQAEVAAAFDFVARGGRLLVLDDWFYYRDLIAPFLDVQRFQPEKVAQLTAAEQDKALEHVKLLNHPNFPAREQAMAELMKLGVKVVPLLESIKPTSAEQEYRIQALVEKLKPPPLVVKDGDDWLLQAAQKAATLHKLFELKTISRNGQMTAGHALCIRLPVMKKAK
jgi:hypothetical protein